MKKIILLFLIIAQTAQAGFYDSDYFEPVMGCSLGAVAGYVTAKAGQEPLTAGIYCAAGALGGILLNNYYRKKVDKVMENKLKDREAKVRAFVIKEARRAQNGDTTKPYSLMVEQVEDGQETPSGDYISPTYRLKLEGP